MSSPLDCTHLNQILISDGNRTGQKDELWIHLHTTNGSEHNGQFWVSYKVLIYDTFSSACVGSSSIAWECWKFLRYLDVSVLREWYFSEGDFVHTGSVSFSMPPCWWSWWCIEFSFDNENKLKLLDCHLSVSFSTSNSSDQSFSVAVGVNVPIHGTPWVPCKTSKLFAYIRTCVQIVHAVKVAI